MSKIIPTVGRIVHYYTAEKPIMGGREPRKGPFAAIITRVHNNWCVDLFVFDPRPDPGVSMHAPRVLLSQEGDAPMPTPNFSEAYCVWMPYQIGQAEKTKAAEAERDSVLRDYYRSRKVVEDADPMYAAFDTNTPKAGNAPRVTLTDIEANIADEYFFTAQEGAWGAHPGFGEVAEVHSSLGLLTFCVLVLKNGFTVTGESACVSPENFDAQMGRSIARQKAVEKIWPLMGYALRAELARPVLTEADADADLAGTPRPMAA